MNFITSKNKTRPRRPGFKGHLIGSWKFWTTIFDPYGPIWTHLDLLRPNCPIWTDLVPFGKVWTNLDQFGPLPINLNAFGQIGCHLEQFGALWTNLDAIGPIESVIFFVLRGCMIYFCPERLHDFFCPERLRDFFDPRGCVIFLSWEVAWFSCSER